MVANLASRSPEFNTQYPLPPKNAPGIGNLCFFFLKNWIPKCLEKFFKKEKIRLCSPTNYVLPSKGSEYKSLVEPKKKGRNRNVCACVCILEFRL
jgi:hypothetical protein